MLRRALIPALLALVVAAPAQAQQRQQLWPGVTYERGVQFTPNGPVAISILRGPRPGGTTQLAPVLSNDSLTGLETLTSMQRRISSSATSAGVNGDYFSFRTGEPSGVYMRDLQVASPPFGDRSSAGVSTDGTLDVRRVEFFATWRGTGVRRTLNELNRVPEANGTSLFTPAFGARTPSIPDTVAVTLFPFPAAVPNSDLVAPVVDVRRASSVSIPIGGAVLVARGSAASRLEAEAPLAAQVTLRLIFRPDWAGIVDAIGGGPQIVRDGVPVFRSGEAFTSAQLTPRAPRTGLGQLGNGSIVLVTVDGRQPGYSVGMTNFELAQTLVRLGAVTGMAFDGGGSSTMAFDGALLNRPSGSERPIANAFMFLYTGVYLPPPAPVVSPNGDGIDDEPGLRYKLVRPSTVVVTLRAPDGSVAYTETAEKASGTYELPFPPPPSPPPPEPEPVPVPEPAPAPEPAPTPTPEPTPPPTPPTTTARATQSSRQDVADGRWRWSVEAVDDTGQPSRMTQVFRVNRTLGFLRTARKRLYLPPLGRDLEISWQQGVAARVRVTIETPAGEVLRTLALRRYEPGEVSLVWNGLGRDRKAVKGGRYLARVVATNRLGRSELTRPFAVQRINGPKPPAE
jgi:hypothetical protein